VYVVSARGGEASLSAFVTRMFTPLRGPPIPTEFILPLAIGGRSSKRTNTGRSGATSFSSANQSAATRFLAPK
jgi:hypothetical protein